MSSFNIPILFIVFNRPVETKKVLASIKILKPKYIYIAADGPRLNNLKDEHNCDLVKKIIEDEIDWPCEKKYLFQKNNQGCRNAVSLAIDWFFKYVEEGIILEDDCLADKSFFIFCEEILNRYRDEERIMHISENNFLFNEIKINSDYYFSRIPHVWGWATWRRAWQKYDVEMSDWPKSKKNKILYKIFSKKTFSYGWSRIFSQVYNHKIDTWDFQWTYAILKNNGFCVNPSVNLVSNIGFSDLATHTNKKNIFANIPYKYLNLRNHPGKIEYNYRADNYILYNNFGFIFIKLFYWKIKDLLKILTK